MPEKRGAPRTAVQWEVAVADGMGRKWRGTAVDVSALGMRVTLPEQLPSHRFLMLSFTPPDGKGPLWVDFGVVWEDPRMRKQHSEVVYGIQFLRLSSIAAQRLAVLKVIE